MAASMCTISFCCSSSIRNIKHFKPTMYSLPSCSSSSSSIDSCLKSLKFPLSSRFSQVGLCHFTPWDGLRHIGISISAQPQKLGRRAKCRGKVVYASLFGVGAPEALVIGVVALLVFGPKGLAEVARNLGKTLRAFQPTIKELQEVSREFKSTLEKEISLDEDPRSMRSTYESNIANSTPSSSISSAEEPQIVSVADRNGAPNQAYSSEEYLKITEEQLKASAAAQQDVTSSPLESKIEPEGQSQASAATPIQQDATSSPPESQIGVEAQSQASQQDVMPSPSESQFESRSQPQDVGQETMAEVPLVQKPESES